MQPYAWPIKDVQFIASTNQDMKFKVVSLFSGAMGLDIGLHQTGHFELLAAVEKIPAFCETARLNIGQGNISPGAVVFESDISLLDPKDVLERLKLKPGEIDVLVGGPPCQSFSTAGKRGTVQDPRGTLLWQFLRFVEVMQPKFFVMENVRGLVSAALRHRPIAERKLGPLEPDEMPGSVLRLFAKDLSSLCGSSYQMEAFEVNSVNYGAPQIRERVLFIGNRYSAKVEFPDPTHGSIREDSESSEADLFNKKPLLPWRTLREALAGLDDADPQVLDFSERKKSYLAKVPQGSNWRSLSEADQKESMGKAWFAKGGRSGWWRRLTYDLPSPTLMTLPNHASTSLCHPEETRALSVREYARIQEFPDNWTFSGKLAEQYTQIGNAVPTRLGRVVGDLVAAELDKLKKRKWRSYPKLNEGFKITYVQSHIRTRSWFKDGQVEVWGGDGDANYSLPKTKKKTKSIG
jgi:DNA (cytosine-5)-methyltransferase 1